MSAANWYASDQCGAAHRSESTPCPPIQVLDAYNTIANGGVFVEPKLVRGYALRQRLR